LIAATVAIDDEGGSALLKRTAERIHADNGQRYGLNDARASPILRFWFVCWNRLPHESLPETEVQRNIGLNSGSSNQARAVRKMLIVIVRLKRRELQIVAAFHGLKHRNFISILKVRTNRYTDANARNAYPERFDQF
jgi:hypothetical protein